MNGTRVYGVAVVVFSFFLGMLGRAPLPADAAWVNGTQFKVGDPLFQIAPTAVGAFVSPTCGTQGGTSLALVPTLLQGLKVTGVDPVVNPLALVVSCLDNSTRSRLNFINPGDGKVIAQFVTSPVPSTGYPHFVFRPDKGDLLGCDVNG